MIRALPLALSGLLLAAGCGSGDRAEALAREGLAQARAGHLDPAVETFRRALREDPGNPKARYNLAVALLTLGRAEEAATEFRAFLEGKPDDAPGHFQLARALARAGRTEEALTALQRSVALGFDEHPAMALPELEPLRRDLRFVQLEAVVAQRAGVRPPVATDFAGRDGVAYGGERLAPAPLPGMAVNGAQQCGGDEARRPGDAGSSEPEPAASSPR
jgi:tetratricopeptide (TPR) repeat protein